MMKRGTTKSPAVGKRVQIPAYADLWMRGARYGTVERVIPGAPVGYDRGATADIFVIRMDHPQVNKRCYRFIADDCTFVQPERAS